MARTVKKEIYAEKRKEILNAAQRLVYTKGYERMTIGDILAELQISSGAFYHYFDSKPAVLAALIDHIRETSEQPLLPIVHDPHLTALEKLQAFFSTIDNLRLAHKADIVALGRVWYNDDNAIVRQKVDEAVVKQRAPLLTAIVQQGVQEGVFTTPYPDQAGEIILALLQGMANAHVRLLLFPEPELDEAQRAEAIITTHAAYMTAIERVLGAPAQALARTDVTMARLWMAALRGEDNSNGQA